ncbi:hypothetical protein F4818DRAFT_237993 [Hypoxylon cercidicola]|nr:hypothetical protein F4818DRAFT_237993 [Hypoxylon cercidicola]
MAVRNEEIRSQSLGEPPLNPYEKPETPFSVSRAASGAIPKSNAELIDTLASMSDKDPQQIASVCARETIWDAVRGGWNPYVLGPGTMDGSGGRLGPNDILRGVPNHYLRDRLMDWTTSTPRSKRRNENMLARPYSLTLVPLRHWNTLPLLPSIARAKMIGRERGTLRRTSCETGT